MNQNDYTKREIDFHFEELKETLSRIEMQTIKTNGRVSNLENWRAYLVGAWAIVSLLVLPSILYIYVQDKEVQSRQIVENQQEIKELIKEK